jgi:hypothetical protein
MNAALLTGSTLNNKAIPKAKEKKVFVRADEQMLSLLNQLKDELGISASESIRRGVQLYFIAKQKEKKGRQLAFVDKDSNAVVEVFSLSGTALATLAQPSG